MVTFVSKPQTRAQLISARKTNSGSGCPLRGPLQQAVSVPSKSETPNVFLSLRPCCEIVRLSMRNQFGRENLRDNVCSSERAGIFSIVITGHVLSDDGDLVSFLLGEEKRRCQSRDTSSDDDDNGFGHGGWMGSVRLVSFRKKGEMDAKHYAPSI